MTMLREIAVDVVEIRKNGHVAEGSAGSDLAAAQP